MPTAMICAGSVHPEEDEPLIEVITDDESGPLGIAAHEIFAAIAKCEDYDRNAIRAKHKVNEKELLFLENQAYKFITYLKDTFDVETWHVEEPVCSLAVEGSAFVIGGTPDIWGVTRDGKMLIVADFKTGRVDRDYEQQVKSYCHAILTGHKLEVGTVTGLICWARDEEIQPYRWTLKEMKEWVEEVEVKIYQWDGQSYSVGAHCGFCRRTLTCIAAKNARMHISAMVKAPATSSELTGTDFIKTWDAVGDLEKQAKAWKERQKERMKAAGPIDIGNGKVMGLFDKNGSAVIDVAKASAYLMDEWNFDDDDIIRCSSMSKTKVQDIVGDRAAPKMKGADKNAVADGLIDAGAMRIPVIQTVKRIKLPKEVDAWKILKGVEA